MKRRDFLKSIGAVVTGLTVAPSVVKAKAPTKKAKEDIETESDCPLWRNKKLEDMPNLLEVAAKHKRNRVEDFIWPEAEYNEIINALKQWDEAY